MTESNQSTWAEQFVNRIQSLSTGDRTALKRSLGVSLRDANAKAWAAFYTIYLRENEWDEEVCFIVACGVAAFHNCSGSSREFPYRLKELREESAGVETKLLQLLDIPLQPSTYFAIKIGRLLRLLLSKGKSVNFAALLQNLKRWEHPSRYVQLRWARIFYGNPIDEPGNLENIVKENNEHVG